MNLKSTASGIVLALTLGGAAMAQNVMASDPQTLMDFFFNEGIPAQLTTDNVDDPKIELRYYGTKFSIYFYGCSNNANCSAIQFFSGYSTEGQVPLETINTWNTERRYARAYISESGSARIEYDIFTGDDGVSQADFSDVFTLWTQSVEKFEDLIDW